MNVRGGRALLNRPGFESVAAIVAEVEDTGSWAEGCDRDGDPLRGPWSCEPHVTLRITDCDRAIGLEIGWETAAARRNSLHKIDTLIGCLSEFREALADEQKRYVARRRKVKPKDDT